MTPDPGTAVGSTIRTPDQRLRIFVSSTLGELADERTAVRRAVEQLRLTPVMFELGARPHPARALYRAYLEQSDVFVGIYWERYGWVAPEEEISGLEDEYSLSTGLPRLVYLKGPAPDREERLGELIERIQADDTVSYKHFSTEDELERLVTEDLAVLLSERFIGADDGAAAAPSSSFGVHVPEPPTTLIGRDEELWELEALVTDVHNRLVTLVGPGGIGKTRLGIELARISTDSFPDGTVMAGLENANQASDVMPAIARALGLTIDRAVDVRDLVAAAIGERRVLLLVDNCEHVLDAAVELGELLERCPSLTLLATSRTPLNLRAERDFPVHPLTIPVRDSVSDEQAAAVQLFMDRARSVRADFTITDENRATVLELCRRLEGIPLALELAAARVRLLSAEALLERLDASFDVLASRAPDMPDRQRTLRAAIEWSYAMLADDERELFARLGVFEGGWTLDAVETICDGDLDVLEALSGLVEKSLVSPWSVADFEPRFRMYEMIRAFAVERFAEAPNRAEVEARHTRHFSELAREGEPRLRSLAHAQWMNRLEPEWANLSAAWGRSLREGDLTSAVDIATCVWVVLWLRGRIGEMLPRLRETESRRPELAGAPRARFSFVAGAVWYTIGEYDDAYGYFDEFDALRDDVDDPILLGAVLLYRAFLAADRWDAPAVRRYLDECETLLRSTGDTWVLGYCLSVRGSLAYWEGRSDLACSYHNEALDLARRSGNDALTMQSLIFQALARLALEEFDAACDYLCDSSELIERFPFYEASAYGFEAAASLAVSSGDVDRAAHALGVADMVREVAMAAVWPLVRGLRDATVVTIEERVGEGEAARLREVGRRMAPHEGARLMRDITNEARSKHAQR